MGFVPRQKEKRSQRPETSSNDHKEGERGFKLKSGKLSKQGLELKLFSSADTLTRISKNLLPLSDTLHFKYKTPLAIRIQRFLSPL